MRDFDASLEQTLRVEGITIPPEALCEDDDEPTLVIVPSALAALAARSMEPTTCAPPRRSRAEQEEEERALRRAVYGIWTVAAVLFATFGMLVK